MHGFFKISFWLFLKIIWHLCGAFIGHCVSWSDRSWIQVCLTSPLFWENPILALSIILHVVMPLEWESRLLPQLYSSSCKIHKQRQRCNTWSSTVWAPPFLLSSREWFSYCEMDRHCWLRRNPPYSLTLLFPFPPLIPLSLAFKSPKVCILQITQGFISFNIFDPEATFQNCFLSFVWNN